MNKGVGTTAVGDPAARRGEADHHRADRDHTDQIGERRGRADFARQRRRQHEDTRADHHVEDRRPKAARADRPGQTGRWHLPALFNSGFAHAPHFRLTNAVALLNARKADPSPDRPFSRSRTRAQ